MSTYDLFKDFVRLMAEKFILLDKKKPIRLISHADSDGISSVSILAFLLNKFKYKYSVTILSQLDDPTLDLLSNEAYETFVFIDLGSGQLKAIVSKFENKNVFILDHHYPQNTKISKNVNHINPMLFGIDGSKELCASGVVYLFCKSIFKEIVSLSHIALIGSIGDQQIKNDLSVFNQEILDDAISAKKIKIEKGIRFFGTQTRPLHKLLEYSTDPFIPGVTGSSEGSIKFLEDLGINYKISSTYRKLNSLNEDEMKVLIKGIVKKRLNEKNPKDIFGQIYTLINEDNNTPYKNAKEFSTVLNACGRLNKGSLGMAICMGSKKAKDNGMDLLKRYKQEILQSLRWYEYNKGSKYIRKKGSYIIINAQANIMPTLIGTIASIISHSSDAKSIEYIITMAQNVDSTTKISIRYSGKENKKVDLRKLINSIMINVPGYSGGHKHAAGALIQSVDEDLFMDNAEKVLLELNN